LPSPSWFSPRPVPHHHTMQCFDDVGNLVTILCSYSKPIPDTLGSPFAPIPIHLMQPLLRHALVHQNFATADRGRNAILP
jgi:hypothetical protein